MVAVVGTEETPTRDPLLIYREAIAAEAATHRADLARRRSREPVRSLTHGEACVFWETVQRVRWPGVPARIVLGHLWPDVLKSLTPEHFRVASVGGVSSLRSQPGYHVIGNPDVFASFERDWLETFTVQAVHVEACFRALANFLGISHDDAILAVDRYTSVARTFTHIVNATGTYNVLTWWSSKLRRPPLPSALVECEDDRVIQAAQRSLQMGRVLTCELSPSEQCEGAFLLPGPRSTGEPLSSTMIREALVGGRFTNAFQDL